jgi:coenzyme F420-reducing hydrogenase delta subunit
MRLAYPPNIRIIRVPCTGKVDLLHIMRAFEKGADGIMVIGCLEGDCHYNSGNLRARKRVAQAQKLLDAVQIGGQRARMFNLSSGEGPLFAKFAREMTADITEMGPKPIMLKNKAA